LHIFANKIVLGGLALSFTNSLCSFGGILLLPLYFQFVRHTNAAISGLYVTPFMLSFVLLSYVGGQISRRLGRTRPTMLVALLLCVAGLLLLASMGSATPASLCLIYMILLGSGIGLVQPNITVAIQNAAARPDVGVATGCMLLFRAIGGATGATLAGAVMLHAGFPAAFLACAAFALAAVCIATLMPDLQLRSAN
jgi:MFS family permease